MTRSGRIGLLGGTFDPIHVGHLAAAAAASAALRLDRVLLLPSLVPPHRPQPAASAYHRFAMVALAAAETERLEAADDELAAPGPSYTAATLARFHAAGWAPSQLFFIAGADAFAEIATWRDYPAILDAAHFVVVDRSTRRAADLPVVLPELDPRMRPAGSAPATAGPTAIFLVDAATPDVSSTAVRSEAAAGHALDGLVPPLVARHIVRHRLYTAGALHTAAAGHRRPADLLHEQEHR